MQGPDPGAVQLFEDLTAMQCQISAVSACRAPAARFRLAASRVPVEDKPLATPARQLTQSKPIAAGEGAKQQAGQPVEQQAEQLALKHPWAVFADDGQGRTHCRCSACAKAGHENVFTTELGVEVKANSAMALANHQRSAAHQAAAAAAASARPVSSGGCSL